MEIRDLAHVFALHPEVDVMANELSKKREKHFLLRNLHASSQAIILSNLHQRLATNAHARAMLIVLDNADSAQYMYADLRTLRNEQDVYFFPCSHRRRQGKDEAMMVQRTEVLSALTKAKKVNGEDKTEKGEIIIVTYPEALIEPVPQPEDLQSKTIHIHTEEEIAQSDLINQLISFDFQRVDFVYEPGQFAVRGGILDVYSYAHDYPYRIDFFGDEVDSIREFDIETQLSMERTNAIHIVAQASTEQTTSSLVEYLNNNTIWVSNDFSLVRYKTSGSEFQLSNIEAGTTIEISGKSTFDRYDAIDFDTLPQPAFNKNFEILIDDLRARMREGYKVYILADQVKQTDRLRAIFEDKESDISFVAVSQTLHAGFVDKSAKICCYTDHEIFERYHRVSLRSENARRGKAIITLKEINQLQIGDYVVHTDHGVGRFATFFAFVFGYTMQVVNTNKYGITSAVSQFDTFLTSAVEVRCHQPCEPTYAVVGMYHIITYL